MTHPWSELKWWNSGERQVVEEKIDDLERAGIACQPKRRELYRALSATPLRDTRVAILGQDPYPTPGQATGVAFSLPQQLRKEDWPPTFRTIIREYQADLHYDLPHHGDLNRWTSQGVLLWNAIPSCRAGQPLSHDWDEWSYLTGEIVEKLSEKGVVFAFLGGVAARYLHRVDESRNKIIRTAHPSPRGDKFGRTPFTGSRIFSTINAKLVEIEKAPINWELKDDPHKGDLQGTGLDRTSSLGGVESSRVLPNILRAKLGGLKRTATSPNIYTTLAF